MLPNSLLKDTGIDTTRYVGNVHKQSEYSEKFEPSNQVCVVPVNPNLSIRFDS